MESAGNTDREIVGGWTWKAITDWKGVPQLYETQLDAQLQIKRDLHVARAAARRSMTQPNPRGLGEQGGLECLA